MVAASVSKGTVLSLAEKLGGTTPSALRRSSIGTSATEDTSVCPSVVSNSASTVSSAGSKQASLSMIPTSELQKQKPKFGGTIKASNIELHSNNGIPVKMKVSTRPSKYTSNNLHKSFAHLDFNNKPDDSTTRKRNSTIANMHRSQGAKLDYFLHFGDKKESRPPNVPSHHSFGTLNYDMSEDTSAHDDSTFHVDEQNSDTWWDPNSPSKKGKKAVDKKDSTNNSFQLVLEPERNDDEKKDNDGHGSLNFESLTRGITHDFNPFENSETSQQNQQQVSHQQLEKSHSSFGAKRNEGSENPSTKRETKDSKSKGDKKHDKKHSKKTTTRRISVKVSGGDIDLSSLDESTNPEQAAKVRAAFQKWKEANEKAKQNENLSGDDRTIGTTRTSSSNKSSSSSSSSKHRSRSKGPSSSSRDEKSDHHSRSRSSSRKPTTDKTNEDKDDDERRRRSRSSTARTKEDEDRRSRPGKSIGKNCHEDDENQRERKEDHSSRRRSSSVADGLKKKDGSGESSSRRSENRGRSVGRKGKSDSCSTKEENGKKQRSKSLSNGLRKIAKESDETVGKGPTDSCETTVSSDQSKSTRTAGRTTPASIRRRCQSLGRGVQRSSSLTSKDIAAVTSASKESAEEKSQTSPEEPPKPRTRLIRGSEHKRSQSIGRSRRRLSNEDDEALCAKSDEEQSDDGCDEKPHRSRSTARRREKETSSCDEGSAPTTDRRSSRSNSVGRSRSVGRRRVSGAHTNESSEDRSKNVIKPVQWERCVQGAEKANDKPTSE